MIELDLHRREYVHITGILLPIGSCHLEIFLVEEPFVFSIYGRQASLVVDMIVEVHVEVFVGVNLGRLGRLAFVPYDWQLDILLVHCQLVVDELGHIDVPTKLLLLQLLPHHYLLRTLVEMLSLFNC